VSVTRFKGLGEMDPLQLRETTMAPETRRLVKLTIGHGAARRSDPAFELLDKLLAKKRAPDRRSWLQEKGNLAEI
jgi:topoisomerase-4 subunit B